MKTEIKSAYLNNPELEIAWVVKQQYHLVRTKLWKFVSLKKNLVQTKKIKQNELLAKSEQRREELLEENEVLRQYYLEGMKLFQQGPYAQKLKNKKDVLGIYL
ncbi:MAG: hypothetical protein MH472_06415 [Bacteroidia bacterium]|nr:hypothetical protein [Bacteroidia bacterium]